MFVRSARRLTASGATVLRLTASSRSKVCQRGRCCAETCGDEAARGRRRAGAREEELEGANDSFNSRVAQDFFTSCLFLCSAAWTEDRGPEVLALDRGPWLVVGLALFIHAWMTAIPIFLGYAAESFKACLRPVTALLPRTVFTVCSCRCLRPGH